jgi:hypothetical protein
MSYGSKKADGVILTGCTISQIERKAELSATGSIASFWSSADYFRSSPGNGHRRGRSPCLKGAKTGLMRHSKKTLFDHLIRARKQRRRNGDAKRFGGLEIHD